MTPLLALAADLLVAILLVATIATSVRLSRRMSRMQQDESAMRVVVAELVTATDKADAAIAALRMTVRDSEQALADRLGAAARHTAQLAEQLTAGEAVIERVSQIAAISRRLAVEAKAVASPQAPSPPAQDAVPSTPAGADRLLATIRLARDVADRSARRVAGQAA
ncbi:DUF6468 domain-containing protein [Enterovirga rhinocerotis]|uniref:DUF6468 domain-containing protein n=1 Tax=Enterovirga rhinocerotis TaxID=1339210 RepID=A0A4R7BT46_9HYPH|nr:DUF6468 domain-containing protein [Enterovirga rhinocerotis]TDR88908.1 hypothetical protein EV668_3393 [Enterovirga rhinocerotis]